MSGYGEIPLVPWGRPSLKQLFRYGTQPIWGSTRILAGDPLANTSRPLFSCGRGQVGQGYQRAVSGAETNILIPGQTPMDQSFDVGGVAWEARGSKTDREAVAAQAYWLWEFTQTHVLQGALGAAQATPAPIEFGDSYRSWEGDEVSVFWFTLPIPCCLPGSVAFDVRLCFGPEVAPAQDTVTIRCTLFGTARSMVEVG